MTVTGSLRKEVDMMGSRKPSADISTARRLPAAHVVFSGRYPGWRNNRFTFPRRLSGFGAVVLHMRAMHMPKPVAYRMDAIPSLTVAGAAQAGSPRRAVVSIRCFPFNCAHQESVREHQISRECRYMGFARQGSAAHQRACGIFGSRSPPVSTNMHDRLGASWAAQPCRTRHVAARRMSERADQPAGGPWQ